MLYLFSALFIAVGVWGYDVAHMTTNWPSVFWVKQNVVLTNLLSIMTLGVMLTTALRPAWLVQRLKGMDGLYRLHCVSGLLAAFTTSIHGLLLLLPAWLRHHQMPWSLDALLCLPVIGRIQLLSILLFYGVLIFFIITLIRGLSYERFRTMHRISIWLYLVLIAHGLLILPGIVSGSLFRWMYLLLHWIGGAIALAFLIRWIKIRPHYSGRIRQIQILTPQILEIEIRLPDAFYDDYHAGQYGLLTLHRQQGALFAPILRENVGQDSMSFVVELPAHSQPYIIDVGGRVGVEGPYGRFYSPAINSQEYWIAGQLGLVHFMAWMEAWLQQGKRHPDVHLFYCLQADEQPLYQDRLQDLLEAIGGQLSVLHYSVPHMPDFSYLARDEDAQFYFYGPDHLKTALEGQIQSSQLHEEFPISYLQHDYRFMRP